jgi:hypothetical protein
MVIVVVVRIINLVVVGRVEVVMLRKSNDSLDFGASKKSYCQDSSSTHRLLIDVLITHTMVPII